MTDQNQRIIVVTGGSRGIGKAIALELASPEATIYVNYRSRKSEAEDVAAEIEKRGGHAKLVPFDINNTEAVTEGFANIVNESGGVDVLVNNAGIAPDGLLLRMKDEDWQRTIDTNLSGTFFCTRAAMKTMLRRKNGGRIVFLTSVIGQMGNAGQSAYAASKAGMIGFMKSVAKEVASRGITVNAIAPGAVRTDMTENLPDAQKEAYLKSIPLRRWAEPEDIARVARFLVSHDSSYITGQVIAVNGGMYL